MLATSGGLGTAFGTLGVVGVVGVVGPGVTPATEKVGVGGAPPKLKNCPVAGGAGAPELVTPACCEILAT